MIDVQNLTKVFGRGPDAVRAVDGISFHVAAGEVYGLLGPNGAGKTTTLRMLLGLLAPTSGDAIIGGKSASREPDAVKQRLGLVSASAGLYQWLTPRETLAYFADLYEVPVDEAESRTAELARVLDLKGFLDRRCATLSTGQKQRVNLARALIHNPPIMLLDEPTRGLDVVGSRVIFDYIGLLRRESKAAIVSTHRLDEAERLCDRFGLLHRGRLCHEGTLQELRSQTGRERLTEMFFDLLDERRDSQSATIAAGNRPHG